MYSLSSFYKSNEWLNLRNLVILQRLNEDGYSIDELTGKPIVNKYDLVVHHKIELTEANVNDYDISLNPDNLMIVSFKSHNIIHSRFGQELPKKVYLVYGSPCSGKSTWVNDNATKDDLVLDIDKIWECISVCDKFHKPNRLKSNVFCVRDTLLDQIKCRVGMWKRAFVIGGYPLATDRERLSKLLGAELIFIDESKDVCLSRCINSDWIEYVEEWFEMYTA